MSRHRATCESLDDDHAAAAMRAGMWVAAIESIGRFGLRRWDVKQLTRPRDVLDPVAAGEQAVVAGAGGSGLRGGGEGATGENLGGERRRLLIIAALVA